jgi:hypothetical protein
MTDHIEIFDVVLYYNRKVFVKPTEPIFGEIQKSNPVLNVDEVLDIYSDFNNKYKEELKKYEILDNKELIVLACALVPEDEDFIKNCKSIENDKFFVKWDKNSYELIKETIKKLIK